MERDWLNDSGFQYEVITNFDNLNKYGKQGWRVVHCIGDNNDLLYLMERKIPRWDAKQSKELKQLDSKTKTFLERYGYDK